MYNVKVTLPCKVEEHTHFLVYYELPEGVGFSGFYASDKAEFIDNFSRCFANLPEDAINYDLFQYVPVQFTEIDRTVCELTVIP